MGLRFSFNLIFCEYNCYSCPLIPGLSSIFDSKIDYMKCGVVTFPGSNCNHDMMYALGNILGQEVVELWHKDTDTQNCELIVLPGIFLWRLLKIRSYCSFLTYYGICHYSC